MHQLPQLPQLPQTSLARRSESGMSGESRGSVEAVAFWQTRLRKLRRVNRFASALANMVIHHETASDRRSIKRTGITRLRISGSHSRAN
eukprot:3915439-Rhodomonas_salina.5